MSYDKCFQDMLNDLEGHHGRDQYQRARFLYYQNSSPAICAWCRLPAKSGVACGAHPEARATTLFSQLSVAMASISGPKRAQKRYRPVASYI